MRSLIAAMIAIFAVQTAPPATPATIAGIAIDDATARPVAGATVEIAATYPVTSVDGIPLELALDAAGAKRRNASAPQRVVTDRDGKFVFRGLLSGPHQITVRHPAYMPSVWGRERYDGFGHPLVIRGGEIADGLVVRLWKLSAIAGRVTDERDDPLVKVEVIALAVESAAGRPRYTVARRTTTDDDGNYRISGLRPGRYVIAVPATVVSVPVSVAVSHARAIGADDPIDTWTTGAPMLTGTGIRIADDIVEWRGPAGDPPNLGARMVAYRTTFHPSQVEVAAATIHDLSPSEDVRAIDVRLMPERTITVRGRLMGPDGPRPLTGVRAISRSTTGVQPTQGFEIAWTVSDAEGRFTLHGIPAGDFTLHAAVGTNASGLAPGTPGYALGLTAAGGSVLRPPMRPGTEPLLWGQQMLAAADIDVNGVELRLQPGWRVRGTYRFEGTAQLPDERQRAGMAVSLSPLDVAPNAVAPNFGGATFVTAAHPPGRYLVTPRHPSASWRVKSILIDNREYIDRALELRDRDYSDALVIFTDVATRLEGTVALPADGTARLPVVVAFPADYETWIAGGMVSRVSWVAPVDRTGAFTIGNFRAGEYLIAAVDGRTHVPVRSYALADHEFVRRIAGSATRFTARDGDNSITLRAIVAPVR